MNNSNNSNIWKHFKRLRIFYFLYFTNKTSMTWHTLVYKYTVRHEGYAFRQLLFTSRSHYPLANPKSQLQITGYSPIRHFKSKYRPETSKKRRRVLFNLKWIRYIHACVMRQKGPHFAHLYAIHIIIYSIIPGPAKSK